MPRRRQPERTLARRGSARTTLLLSLLAVTPAAAAAAPAADAPAEALAAAPAASVMREGSRAFRAGRYAAAAALFRRAAALDPRSGEALVMSGLAEYERGDHQRARGDLRRALQRPLSGEDRDLARTYLELLAAVAEADDPWPFHLRAELGAGFDSNVAQAPARDDAIDAAAGPPTGGRGDAFASAALTLGGGRRFGDSGSCTLEYGFFQVAYLAGEFDEDSFQVHALELGGELWVTRWLRLSLPVRGDASFTGLRTTFTPLQWSGSAQPELTLRMNGLTRLRVAAGYTRKQALDPAFGYLTGERRELQLTQDVELGDWLLSVRGRYRQEALGESRGTLGVMPAESPCPGCLATHVTSHDYQGMSAGARLAAPWAWRLRPSASALIENRSYGGVAHLEATDPAGNHRRWATMQRRDLRLGMTAAVALRLSQHWQLTARYDHVQNHSSLDGSAATRCPAPAACHPLAFDDRSFVKHAFALELEADWM